MHPNLATVHKEEMYGPTLPISQELHGEKYRQQGEQFYDAMVRIAGALKDSEEHYRALKDIALDMRFLPAGRVQASVGSAKAVTPYNCFVSGTIEDSFTDGYGSIMARATEAATTMRMGGGIGYDFSTLRPNGSLIKKLMSHSSGPISFMQIFDAVCRCVASSGHRRGAQMGVMRVDHPDIEEFIHAKQNSDNLTGFNISIAVTDEFMQCVVSGEPFTLRFNNETYKTIDARVLWDQIMRSTWDWAEPGVLFIDKINRDNNLWYCEQIAATNPCGEQPLPPHGACLLGSFNLTKYLLPKFSGINGSGYIFDYDQLREDIPHVVRAMDNVIDIASYPLYEQEKEAKHKRRMGLGVTGLANTLETLGFPYGSEQFLEAQGKILETIRDESYRASVELAKEKGPFPLFKAEAYLDGNFVKDLPADIREGISQHGIRNSHLTSIAPTGTISLTADNISSGIEPVFSYSYDRIVNRAGGQTTETIEDYAYRTHEVKGKRTADVSVSEHLAVLATAQKYVDSAVSKTCNVGSDVSWDDFKDIYMAAWRLGCKGITTFRDAGKRGGILIKTEDDDKPQACFYNPETGKREGCE